MHSYVSYICNDNYIKGVIALVKSLRYNKCSYNILIMVTKDVSKNSRNNILNLGCEIVEVKEIHYEGTRKNLIEDRYGRLDKSWMMFTKINIWKQLKYNKLLYIDADTVVLKNIDHIFEIDENFSAVFGGSTFHNYKGIEAGVMLIKPSIKIFNELVKGLNDDKYDLRMSDQSLINDFFYKNYKINYLPEIWNRLQKKNLNYKGCNIYHWNSQKPWNNKKVHNFNLWSFYYNLILK